MVNQKEISKYVKQAGQGCPFSFRRKLTAELLTNLSDFLDGHPEFTIDDVWAHFGAPEKYADEYLLSMNMTDRQKLLRTSRQVKRTVYIGIALTVLIIATAAIWIVRENSRSVGYYYTEEVHVSE